MNDQSADRIRGAVRSSYAAIATEGGNSGCCVPADNAAACGPSGSDMARQFGYSEDELGAVPEGANMGLGCGNPAAIASLKPGDVVLDLGSGGGFDCFLAAPRVGAKGRVIGVDMTPEMLAKARANAAKGGFDNVEFRLGEIEHLPVADNSVDVIISNCVVNLSPDKPQVLAEAFRVLAPGGRIAISDVVATADFPDDFADDEALLCGCVTGAAKVDDLKAWLSEAGFVHIAITVNEASREGIKEWAPGRDVENYVVSATIEARKGAPSQI